MQSQSGLKRIPAVLFFPDSAYLTTKWWHRLALVIFWMWLICALTGAIHALWDIWEGFEYARDLRASGEYYSYNGAAEELIEGAAFLLSMFVPVAVYRVLLFIGVGNTWKGQPARPNTRLEQSRDS